jgi:hypothetical protein
LALHDLSAVGRLRESVFGGATLVKYARHRGRVEVTFAPPAWGGLTVRGSWGPTPAGNGVDLEVQISATTIGELNRIEVGVLTLWDGHDGEPPQNPAGWVEPRDIPSAASSYDGRESLPTLQSLTTLAVPASSPHTLMPRIFALPGAVDDLFYVEMVQPNDCARRILSGPHGEPSAEPSSLSTRYGLFGHDLEKGVVLRARLRGLWIRSKAPEVDARSHLAEFLSKPLPLGP